MGFRNGERRLARKDQSTKRISFGVEFVVDNALGNGTDSDVYIITDSVLG